MRKKVRNLINLALYDASFILDLTCNKSQIFYIIENFISYNIKNILHRKIAKQFFASTIFTLLENLNKYSSIKKYKVKFSQSEICQSIGGVLYKTRITN